jgi:hypothetical protein
LESENYASVLNVLWQIILHIHGYFNIYFPFFPLPNVVYCL